VAGDDERPGVAGSVGGDELRIGEEGAPRPADGAEAAEVLGRDGEQDLVPGVDGEDAGHCVRPGALARRRLHTPDEDGVQSRAPGTKEFCEIGRGGVVGTGNDKRRRRRRRRRRGRAISCCLCGSATTSFGERKFNLYGLNPTLCTERPTNHLARSYRSVIRGSSTFCFDNPNETVNVPGSASYTPVVEPNYLNSSLTLRVPHYAQNAPNQLGHIGSTC
jgi:hypothetical protein